MKLRFIKLANKWYVDIPYIGDINDLQMVCGADLLLENIANGKFYVEVNVATTYIEHDIALIKIDENSEGASYDIKNNIPYRGEVWLCNITKNLFDLFPETFYLKILNS